MTATAPSFTVEAFHNEYLPEGSGEVDSIVSVTAAGLGAATTGTDAAEVIVIDCSGSMGDPATKIAAARRATRTALDALPDGVVFVAHYTGQAELAEAIQEGLDAWRTGDVRTATARLGRAVALAAASGNEDTSALLARVVDVEDPATGRVRLRREVTAADEMTLDVRSTRTARVRER